MEYGTANSLPVYPSPSSPDNHNSTWLTTTKATDHVFSTPANDPYASPTPYTPDHAYPAYPQSPSIRNDHNMHPAIAIPTQIPPSIGPTRITRRQARAQSTLHLGIRRDHPPSSATHHDSEEVCLVFYVFFYFSVLDPSHSPRTSCPLPVPFLARRHPSAPPTRPATNSHTIAAPPIPSPPPCPSHPRAISRPPSLALPSPSIPLTPDLHLLTPRLIRAPLLPP